MNIFETDRGHRIVELTCRNLESINKSLSALVELKREELNKSSSAFSGTSVPEEPSWAEDLICAKIARSDGSFDDWMSELDDVLGCIKQFRSSWFEILKENGFDGFLKKISNCSSSKKLEELMPKMTFALSRYLSYMDLKTYKEMLPGGRLHDVTVKNEILRKHNELLRKEKGEV